MDGHCSPPINPPRLPRPLVPPNPTPPPTPTPPAPLTRVQLDKLLAPFQTFRVLVAALEDGRKTLQLFSGRPIGPVRSVLLPRPLLP